RYGRPLSEPVAGYWRLDEIGRQYTQFLSRFGDLPAQIKNAPASLTPDLAIIIRSLAVHEFRRALLHDPRLPIELLPEQWAGKMAYELCSQLYRATYRKDEQYIMSALQEEDHDAAPTADLFFERLRRWPRWATRAIPGCALRRLASLVRAQRLQAKAAEKLKILVTLGIRRGKQFITIEDGIGASHETHGLHGVAHFGTARRQAQYCL